jgi:ketosteroid isomerase-like protein
MDIRSASFGAAAAIGARGALPWVLRQKFARDVEKLNAGDHAPLLSAYADDFVLRFHDGDHRWAGEWRGRAGMDAFLRNFAAARIRGDIKGLATSGPPWALTLWVRFDDHADGPDGTRIYENRTVLVLGTRWGKVVEQQDFYVDTDRITAFDRELTKLGVEPVPNPAGAEAAVG